MNDGQRGWNFESQCHEMRLLYDEQMWGEWVVRNEKELKGIMGRGCSICEGQRTIDRRLKSLAHGNAIAS